MTDPSNALESFQQEILLHGKSSLQHGVLNKNIFVHFDSPNGQPRFTYVRFEGETVTALVMFALTDPIDGIACFGIGYAVPQSFRNQGRAKEAITTAIIELQHGLASTGRSVFYVEAIIGVDNRASQRVAEKLISDCPVAITDQISGLPAFRYVRKIGTACEC